MKKIWFTQPYASSLISMALGGAATCLESSVAWLCKASSKGRCQVDHMLERGQLTK